MKTFDYENDYTYIKKILNDEIGGLFKGIFYCSNESVPLTLLNYDLHKKDILSIVGSGDQLIHLMNRGASNVDLFDICCLPKYYIYLRKWLIKYREMFYPDFDCFSSKIKELDELFSEVECNSKQEEEALLLWKYIVKEQIEFNKIFYYPPVKKDNIITDFSNLDAFTNLSEFDFYQFDLCGEGNFPEKKYDIIYSSNVIEHCDMDRRRIQLAKENVSRLLKDGGTIICTQIFSDNFDLPRIEQNDIFSDEFVYDDIMLKKYINGHDFYIGYSYTKKKKNGC